MRVRLFIIVTVKKAIASLRVFRRQEEHSTCTCTGTTPGEKEGEVKSLYNITLEQFDHYGYQYAELTSAKPPTLRFSELPVTGRKLDPEGNVVFACIRRKAWSDPQAGFKCCPQEICWMYLDEDTDPDDGMVTVGYPWNSTPRHPSYPCRQLKWSTFVIQYHIFYDFHGLIDGPVSNL